MIEIFDNKKFQAKDRFTISTFGGRGTSTPLNTSEMDNAASCPYIAIDLHELCAFSVIT
jgi:hypothetical protein